MEHTIKSYKQQFEQASGNNLARIKTVVEANMDHWFLEEESLLIDLLDDPNVTAEDIVDTLSDMVSYDEGNTAFKNAVLAMHLCLEKSRLSHIKNADLVSYEEQETEAETICRSPDRRE